MDYKQAGVDVHEGYRAVEKYKAEVKRTLIPGVLNGIGGFAGMFEVPKGYKEPVMVSGTDGVGTKLDIAFALKKYDTVGIDCVAMCVNDILCCGARPLYFLDYIACGNLDSSVAADLVKGIADGCVQSGCALLGGETAEMPGFYDNGKYDIAGFSVGIAEKARIISGENISEGDVLIGLASSGVHSNGFSLVRRLVKDLHQPFGASSIGITLLEPTRIYVKPVLDLLESFENHATSAVRGMVHITGGGFYENIPRMFTAADALRRSQGKSPLCARIRKDSWPALPIFGELVKLGADADKMFYTFNMGIGFVLALSPDYEAKALEFFKERGIEAYSIGKVDVSAATASISSKLAGLREGASAALTQEQAVLFE